MTPRQSLLLEIAQAVQSLDTSATFPWSVFAVRLRSLAEEEKSKCCGNPRRMPFNNINKNEVTAWCECGKPFSPATASAGEGVDWWRLKAKELYFVEDYALNSETAFEDEIGKIVRRAKAEGSLEAIDRTLGIMAETDTLGRAESAIKHYKKELE